MSEGDERSAAYQNLLLAFCKTVEKRATVTAAAAQKSPVKIRCKRLDE